MRKYILNAMRLALCGVVVVVSTVSNHATAQKLKYSVEADFNRTLLMDTNDGSRHRDRSPFAISPDGEYLFFIMRNGIYKDNTYRFALVTVSVKEIDSYVEGRDRKKPNIIAIHDIKYDMRSADRFGHKGSAGIKKLVFSPGGQSLFFLAADDHNFFQIYEYNLFSGTKRQITFDRRHVLDYLPVDDDRLILSYGYFEPDEYCKGTYFNTEKMHSMETICVGNGLSLVDYISLQETSPYYPKKDIYSVELGAATIVRKVVSKIGLMVPLSSAVFSPDKEYLTIKLRDLSPPVGDRTAFAESYDGKTPEEGLVSVPITPRYDERTHRTPFFEYYATIRLSDGEVIRHQDTPIIYSNSLEEPRWVGKSTVFLPGTVAGGRAMMDRRAYRSDGRSRGYIVDITRQREKKAAVMPQTQTSRSFIPISGGASNDGRQSERSSRNGRCVEVDDGSDVTKDGDPYCYVDIREYGLRVYIDEKSNTIPSIWVENNVGNKRRSLIDLGGETREYSFGKIEHIQWTDETGYNWNGGLVYPVNYQTGKTYPLVVQMNGYDPNKFLAVGPYHESAPFAAQMLANRGIMVVQIAERKPPEAVANDHPFMARGVNAAIRYLEKRGVIDTSRIGLVGYSFRGKFVFNMATWPEIRPKAIVVADAVSPSIFGYFNLHRAPPPGVLTPEGEACDARPWGDKQKQWIARNPFFWLDGITTAVMIQDFSAVDVSAWWDIIAGMQRLGKPVEHVRFLSGGHPPQFPQTVIEARQMTVEWFDFWLNGSVNMTAGRQERYQRWERLRARSEIYAQNLENVTPLSKMDCSSVPSNAESMSLP